jgi:hypothetical protein
MRQALTESLVALALGFVLQLLQEMLGTHFLDKFLTGNLITLLIALVAINSATTGIVLTKIRDLVETRGHGDIFSKTRTQMVLAVRQQVALIIVGIVLLMSVDSPLIVHIPSLTLLFRSMIAGVFINAMMILYDTAKGVLIIVDFDG